MDQTNLSLSAQIVETHHVISLHNVVLAVVGVIIDSIYLRTLYTIYGVIDLATVALVEDCEGFTTFFFFLCPLHSTALKY